VWRGNALAADIRKLPAASDATFTVDTVLDFACDWSELLERPPLGAFAQGVGVQATPDASGAPGVFRLADDPSGLTSEVHVVPIAPRRSRALLRQRLPRSSPLAPVLASAPEPLRELLTLVVRNANYKVALEAYEPRQQGQAGQQGQPAMYFSGWNGFTERERRYGEQTDDEAASGTYGLKRSYVQQTPRAEYAPMASTGLLERLRSTQDAVAAAVVSVPAALVTYKTVGPAMAAIGAMGAEPAMQSSQSLITTMAMAAQNLFG